MKRIALLLSLCVWQAVCSSPLLAADDGYHPGVGDFARVVKGGYRFPFNFGPTGATGWFYDREFVINGLDKGSPADGVLRINDRIRAVNGVRFPEKPTFTDDEHDPRRVLGDGITKAEATDGRLVVTVWRDNREQDLAINLPVLGSYSPTWPYDCPKSQKILGNACDYLAAQQLPEGGFFVVPGDGDGLASALNGMLWLGSGDPEHLENARRLAYYFAANPGPDPLQDGGKSGGMGMWGWSYQAMFIAEYYLLTGDTTVLPYLEWLHKVIMAADHQRGSWCHGFINSNYAVGGYINQTGVMCLNALSLMQLAGFELDQKDLEHCKHYFRRYSYGGRSIAYGDHKSNYQRQPGGTGVGKNAIAILPFENFGETDTVARFVTTVIDSYRRRDGAHTGPFFNLIWGPIGASRGTPEQFRLFMDYWTWFHDMGRRWDGSFLLPSQNDGAGYAARGPLWTMGGQAMVYALPLKLTRLCGATESPFDVSTMPSELAPIKALVDKKQYAQAAADLDALLAAGLDGKAKARAEVMQRSLKTTLASIDHTLAAVAQNLQVGESVLARTRIQNLEQLLGPGDARIAALKEQAAEPRHDVIAAAWKEYLAVRYPSYVDVPSYEKMKALSANSEAGFVRQRAAETVAAIHAWPSYRDSFDSESVLNAWVPQWKADKNATLPLAVTRYLAFGDGIIWTSWAPRGWLTEDNLLGEFPFSTPLAATSDSGQVDWKYQTMDQLELPAGWNTAGFDDSAWQVSAAPVCSPTPRRKGPEHKWDKPFMLLRRTFEVADPAFTTLRIKALVHDEADIYLNGVHIARILTERRKGKAFTDFDVTSAGLPALKKGTNVLAVKAVRDGGHIDVGIMGVKRP
jgi:hypothetical protein